MHLKESKAEQIIGIVFVALGLIAALIVIPMQIKEVSYDIIFNSPRFFPTVIAMLFILLGAALFVSGLRKKDAEEQEEYSLGAKEAKLVLITLGTMVVYTALLYFLPYIPVTMLVLAFLIWIYGQKSWKKIVITALVLPVIIYISFRYGLMLRMP